MIVKLVFILLGIVFSWLIYKFVIGHRIGVRLADFEDIYDKAISDSFSKPEAFKKSVDVFKKCYPYSKLSFQEWEKIGDTFGSLANPKKTFSEIMLYPSRKVLNILKNSKNLEELKSKQA